MSIFAHGGNPIPCVHPFAIQNTAKSIESEVQPKRKFMSAENASPSVMKMRPLRRSAQKPFTNLLSPYSTPCTVIITPSACFVITPSSIISGCAMERFLRVM